MPQIVFQSPLGTLGLSSNTHAITTLSFLPPQTTDLGGLDDPVLAQAYEELQEYFAGKRRVFSVPCEPQKGTLFQRAVWGALQEIPYGECVSYKTIAARIGNPKAVRAVGGANNKNPIAILIPCHRVIGASGSLVGYASGVDKKVFLLNHEGYSLPSKSI
ncbi:methylated-DNA--[protein]-cysteine S-methyltransferase [Sulfurospirillum sp. T05]|uniref:Methylated-DNA--protein-cysteine methyltransferase n=1 Tax=Sulfurospirillum tamanense TaxID=2813362 RepID=A0ABS2WV22_9BACT|nr:methylated-DNA--[protein]-cysteine S-methyltransferase [Sulfurospirillum tamanensis]MBN2965507.1 methylated-DNA--[protein]-cysteine S-methyltransferase [Sulfurospirillum tamanensis]